MTPAEELRDAVRLLRDPVNCLPKALTEALADWLDSWDGIDFTEQGAALDDLQYALRVARAVRKGTS